MLPNTSGQEPTNAGTPPSGEPPSPGQGTPPPPPPGQGPEEGEPFDRERAMDTIRKQRASEEALTKEVKDLRAKVKEFEDAESARQQADMTELEKTKTALEKATTQVKDLESQLETVRLRNAIEREAAKQRFRDPADAYALVDRSQITIQDGEVKGVQEAIETLAKARPYLIDTGKSPPDTEGDRGGGGRSQADAQRIREKYRIS